MAVTSPLGSPMNTLPRDHYFVPREGALKTLLEKYPGNETVKAFVAVNRHEVDLYEKYKQTYGYVFYIGRKL